METQEHLSLAMPTEPQYRTWGELGYAFGGGHGFDTMVLSPGVEALPMLGDWATLSNPFHMNLADGWPLPYHDAAVAAMATPQHIGGGLLSPGDSIASAQMDTSYAPWHDQPPFPQVPGGPPPSGAQPPAQPERTWKKKRDERPMEAPSPSQGRKKKGKSAPGDAGTKKTKKQKKGKRKDAKASAAVRAKGEQAHAAPAFLPTPAEGGANEEHDDPEAAESADDAGADGPPRRTQRERNRVAATKCRAKSKAASNRLAADEQMLADTRQTLGDEARALRDEAVRLRMLVLQHHGCACAEMQAYIRNSAGVIGQSGGRAVIFGPDGYGFPVVVVVAAGPMGGNGDGDGEDGG